MKKEFFEGFRIHIYPIYKEKESWELFIRVDHKGWSCTEDFLLYPTYTNRFKDSNQDFSSFQDAGMAAKNICEEFFKTLE